jgi:hypothetical protein
MTLCQIQALLGEIGGVMTMYGMLERMRRKGYGPSQDTDLDPPEIIFFLLLLLLLAIRNVH